MASIVLWFRFVFPMVILLAYAERITAQHTEATQAIVTEAKHITTFIVRKPDMVRTIEERFHLAHKDLKNLNPHLHKWQMLYAGGKVVIPVWFRRKNGVQDESAGFNLTDFALDLDSLDANIREDFICLADIEADTVRRIAIDKELKRLDRKMVIVNDQLDSIEAESMQNVSSREVLKVEIDKARHSGKFSMGTEIDSLVKQKKKISEERSKINMRVYEYEYLIENEAYEALHAKREETIIQIRE